MNPLKRTVEKIREINQRYAEPRIRLSKGTRIALLALRLYLVFLVLLLVYKLIISL